MFCRWFFFHLLYTILSFPSMATFFPCTFSNLLYKLTSSIQNTNDTHDCCLVYAFFSLFYSLHSCFSIKIANILFIALLARFARSLFLSHLPLLWAWSLPPFLTPSLLLFIYPSYIPSTLMIESFRNSKAATAQSLKDWKRSKTNWISCKVE